MRAVAVRVVRSAVQALVALLLAAGLGALVASVVAMGTRIVPESAAFAALLAIALRVAFIFLVCASAAFLLLPRAADLIPHSVQPAGARANGPALAAMVTLGAAGAAQIPPTLAWWAECLAVLRRLPGLEPDHMGMHLVPRAVLLSTPMLGSLALVAAELSVVLVLLARRDRSLPTLAACTAVQTGFVVGAYHSRAALAVARSWLESFLPQMAEADPARVYLDALARYAELADPRLRALGYVLGIAVAALVVRGFSMRRGAALDEHGASATAPSLGASTSPLVPSLPSTAAHAFESANYAVKPRGSWLEGLLFRKYTEYDIQTVPPTARSRFSYSRRTGVIRREPDGPDLIALRPEGDGWVSRKYVVVDAATGAIAGTLRRVGGNWEIAGPQGIPVATVIEDRRSYARVRYAAMVGPHEIGTYTWAIRGASILSAELDVELSREHEDDVDRALLVALAPLLETQARSASRG